MVAQALELSRKPHVVIATPGRLADHLRSSNTFNMKKIRFLVSQVFPSDLEARDWARKHAVSILFPFLFFLFRLR